MDSGWHGVAAPPGLVAFIHLYVKKSRSNKCMLHFHYLPSEWQLITISLFMRKTSSAFLFQTEAIDIPRIVSGEGKPIAKCSFGNNLQSEGQAWGQSLLVLTDKGSKALCGRPGLGAAGARRGRAILAGRTPQSPGISACPPQEAVGCRDLGRWGKRRQQGVSA